MMVQQAMTKFFKYLLNFYFIIFLILLFDVELVVDELLDSDVVGAVADGSGADDDVDGTGSSANVALLPISSFSSVSVPSSSRLGRLEVFCFFLLG